MRISDWSSDVCSSDLQRHHPKDDAEEQRLTADIIALAKDYGRYGYRSIHALLGHAGWQISLSVVERIWRREGLKVPKKQPKRHACGSATDHASGRSEEHTSELQSLMRIQYAVFCLKKKKIINSHTAH